MALINLRNALMAGKRLPYDAEVEYLESTGTQWIDTGIVPTDSTGFQVLSRCLGTGVDNNYRLIGVQDGSVRCLFSTQTVGSNNTFFGWNSPVGRLGLFYNVDVLASLNFLNNRSAILNGQTKASNLSTLGTITLRMYLFGNNSQAGNMSNNFIGRVYSAKISENSTLVRDFIPVRKGTVGYMYDRVTGLMKPFGNAGTGDFVVGPDVVPVEYIESHGTEYIDTGYAFQDNFAWEITFNGLGSSQTLFGGRTAAVRTSLLYQRDRDYLQGEETTITIAGYTGTTTPFVLPDLKSGTHTVKAAFAANKGSVWVDGVAQYTNQSFSGTYISGVPHVVFADNFGNGDVREFATSKVYGLKMWQNSIPVRSFRPVRVGTEGAMMDTLTRRIYRNAGTGAFTYGNDLKYPIPA